MKKILTAVAITFAAVCTYGANFTWGNGSYSIDNWKGDQAVNPDLEAPMYEGGTMFLYLGTIGYTEGKGFDLTAAQLVTLGGYNADEYLYGAAGVYASSDLVNKNGGQDYTLVLVNNATYNTLADVKDGDYFVMRNGTSQGQYAADIEDFKADFTDFEAIGKSDWQAYSVPEPTSGLLLLLGVAGLALKRKKA